jgi:hypothetical protein
MDNCARENKNRYVLSYCNYLIQQKVFNTIELSFLPVGHTHEDIDQMFSRFAEYFRTYDAPSISDFMKGIKSAYTPVPIVERIYEILDFKSIINSEDILNIIEGMNLFSKFKFLIIIQEHQIHIHLNLWNQLIMKLDYGQNYIQVMKYGKEMN